MKKFLSWFLILVLLVCLGSSLALSAYADEGEGVVVVETSPTPDVEVTEVPEATSAPSASPAVTGLPVVTKSPTAENITAGKGTSFVARADNCTSYQWKVILPDGNTVSVDEANAKYGAVISGDGTQKISLHAVPAAMSGCSFYCIFFNDKGSVGSDKAKLTVTEAPLPSATPIPVATPSPATGVEVAAEDQPVVEVDEPVVVEEAEEHVHAYPAAWYSDSDSHWHECDCGEVTDRCQHQVKEWAKLDKHTEIGICTICGAGVSRDLQSSGGGHVFGTILKVLLIAALIGAAALLVMKKLPELKQMLAKPRYQDEVEEDDFLEEEEEERPVRAKAKSVSGSSYKPKH